MSSLQTDEWINTKREFKKYGVGWGLNSSGSVQDPLTSSDEDSNEPLSSTKCGKFLDHVSDYQLLKEDCSVEFSNKTGKRLSCVLAARSTITNFLHAYSTGSRSDSLQTTNHKFSCAQSVHHYYICNGFMFNIKKSSLQVCHFTHWNMWPCVETHLSCDNARHEWHSCCKQSVKIYISMGRITCSSAVRLGAATWHPWSRVAHNKAVLGHRKRQSLRKIILTSYSMWLQAVELRERKFCSYHNFRHWLDTFYGQNKWQRITVIPKRYPKLSCQATHETECGAGPTSLHDSLLQIQKKQSRPCD
jgi:hypothetical protein